MEKGITTGCILQVIVFSAAMNLIMKSAEQEHKGPTLTGKKTSPRQANIDVITITTSTVM